jgi:hypothetical protein
VKTSLKAIPLFIIHQVIGTCGVAVFAYFLGSSVFELFRLFDRHYSMRPLYWILTETPFFPVQIALGFCLGWWVGRRYHHRSMIWVWILPILVLCYALLDFPSLNLQYASVFSHSSGPLSHYFGWGCSPQDRCLDQLLITMPFYAAAAYSMGGWLAFAGLDRKSQLRH